MCQGLQTCSKLEESLSDMMTGMGWQYDLECIYACRGDGQTKSNAAGLRPHTNFRCSGHRTKDGGLRGDHERGLACKDPHPGNLPCGCLEEQARRKGNATLMSRQRHNISYHHHVLSIYSKELRQRQSTLYKGVQDEPHGFPDLHVASCQCGRTRQDELRELSFKATLRAMDASWWDLRRQLDRYLDSYDAYLRPRCTV